MNAFTRPQIDYFQAVVPQRADKQALVRQIDREMVDAAFYVGQCDDLARRLRRRSLGGRAQSNGDRNNNEGLQCEREVTAQESGSQCAHGS